MSGATRGHLLYNGRKVLLKYHRLLSGVHPHPPNSVTALRHVLADGAEAIEFDVGLTRDEQYVLLHGAELESETSGRGPLRQVTEAEFKALRLRDSDEPPATLAEVVAIVREVGRPVKLQVDLKETAPLSSGVADRLLRAVASMRENPSVSVIVGGMGDWNLRLLRRLDPALAVGLDFANHLDAAVGDSVGLRTRVNAYGYLDDHPLGESRGAPARAYLEGRMEELLNLVPGAGEVYVRKEFLLQALGDGFNPIEFIHHHRPGALVDVWTLYAHEPNLERTVLAALDAGADQLTSPTPVRLIETFEKMHG